MRVLDHCGSFNLSSVSQKLGPDNQPLILVSPKGGHLLLSDALGNRGALVQVIASRESTLVNHRPTVTLLGSPSKPF